MKKRFLQLFLSVLIFITFILVAYFINVKEYILDSILFIVLIVLMNYYYDKFSFNEVSYWFIVLGMMSHNLGVLGWYNQSPFIIQYDHITHFVGFIGVGMFLYEYLKVFNKVERIIIVLLISLGIGSLIELIEFIGYLKLGVGDGLFYYGGIGDTGVNLRAMDAVGGGWLNTMWDLVYNLFGSLLGIVLRKIRS